MLTVPEPVTTFLSNCIPTVCCVQFHFLLFGYSYYQCVSAHFTVFHRTAFWHFETDAGSQHEKKKNTWDHKVTHFDNCIQMKIVIATLLLLYFIHYIYVTCSYFNYYQRCWNAWSSSSYYFTFHILFINILPDWFSFLVGGYMNLCFTHCFSSKKTQNHEIPFRDMNENVLIICKK